MKSLNSTNLHNHKQFPEKTTLDDACEDDPTINCTDLNKKFNVCGNVMRANVSCPKTCGLCYQGSSTS